MWVKIQVEVQIQLLKPLCFIHSDIIYIYIHLHLTAKALPYANGLQFFILFFLIFFYCDKHILHTNV